MTTLVPAERIEPRIVVLRAQKVMLDTDLAALYGVPSKALNQAVKRNRERFPADFMFQLTWDEALAVRSQSVTLKDDRPRSQSVTLAPGQNIKYRPYAFTEQGVAMLSSVLRSRRAVLVNMEIMRAFVRLRTMAWSVAELRRKVDGLERRYDAHFKDVFDAIRELMAPPAAGEKRRIGFRPEPSDECAQPVGPPGQGVSGSQRAGPANRGDTPGRPGTRLRRPPRRGYPGSSSGHPAACRGLRPRTGSPRRRPA
jgi:ORF6N domain-containing protein